MELSTTLRNNLLAHYNTTKIVCPPTLKSNVFTTAALDKKTFKKLYGPFLWMGFNCLKARATSRRQFTFYH